MKNKYYVKTIKVLQKENPAKNDCGVLSLCKSEN